MIRKTVQWNGGLGLVIWLIFLGISVFTWADAAQTPLQVIRAGTNRVLEMIRPCQPGESISVHKYKNQILDIVNDYFDFKEMAMRTLGPEWRKISPQQQNEFATLFEKLLFKTYMDRVDTYTCSNEEVIYGTERIEGKYALVKTQITGYKDSNVSVDYRMKLTGGEWKVYDVVVEGISLVNNYRSQFRSILNRQSFDSLLEQMREKAASR